MGLLFVESILSQPQAQTIISALRKLPEIDKYHQDATGILHLFAGNKDNFTGNVNGVIKTTSTPFELGKTYHVYTFVQDAGDSGEVFLSNNKEILEVPKVAFGDVSFNGKKVGKKWKYDDKILTISNVLFPVERKGFITHENPNIPRLELQAILERIREDAVKKIGREIGEKNTPLRHESTSSFYFEQFPIRNPESNMGNPLTEKTMMISGQPGLRLPMKVVAAGKNFVFWQTIASTFGYEKDDDSDPIVDLSKIKTSKREDPDPEYEYSYYRTEKGECAFFRFKKGALMGKEDLVFLEEDVLETLTGPDGITPLKGFLFDFVHRIDDVTERTETDNDFMARYAVYDPRMKKGIHRSIKFDIFRETVNGAKLMELLDESLGKYNKYRTRLFKEVYVKLDAHFKAKGEKTPSEFNVDLVKVVLKAVSGEIMYLDLRQAIVDAIAEEERIDAFIKKMKDDLIVDLNKTTQGKALIDRLNDNPDENKKFFQLMRDSLIENYQAKGLPVPDYEETDQKEIQINFEKKLALPPALDDLKVLFLQAVVAVAAAAA